MSSNKLSFATLRAANMARLPQFKNCHGGAAHSKADGSDWTVAQWVQAVLGELGEFANQRKKFERGDLTFEEYAVAARKELADVQTYLDILALRALDRTATAQMMGADGKLHVYSYPLAHPTGIDLGQATTDKFNEVSARVGSNIFLAPDGARALSVSG